MDNDGTKITAPVHISDVQTVLGTSSNDLGTLCRNTNINRWNKYKPVNGVPAGLDAIFPGTNTDWWKGINLNCGLIPAIITNPRDVPTVSGGANDWDYDRPFGTLASPFRLTDFNGYIHDVLPPFNTGKTNDIESIQVTQQEASITIRPNWSNCRLFPQDFQSNGDVGSSYFTATVYRQNGTIVGTWQAVDSNGVPAKIGSFVSEEDMYITIPTTITGSGQWQTQTYIVYTFLSTVSLEDGDPISEDEIMYSIPYSSYKNPFNLIIRSSSVARFTISFLGIGETRERTTSVSEPFVFSEIDNRQPDEFINAWFGLMLVKFKFTSSTFTSVDSSLIDFVYINTLDSSVTKRLSTLYVCEVNEETDVRVGSFSLNKSIENGKTYVAVLTTDWDGGEAQHVIESQISARDVGMNSGAGSNMDYFYYFAEDTSDDFPVTPSEVV